MPCWTGSEFTDPNPIPSLTSSYSNRDQNVCFVDLVSLVLGNELTRSGLPRCDQMTVFVAVIANTKQMNGFMG